MEEEEVELLLEKICSSQEQVVGLFGSWEEEQVVVACCRLDCLFLVLVSVESSSSGGQGEVEADLVLIQELLEA